MLSSESNAPIVTGVARTLLQPSAPAPMIIGGLAWDINPTSASFFNLNTNVDTNRPTELPRVALSPVPSTPATGNIGYSRPLAKFARHMRRRDRLPKTPAEKRFWLLHRWQGQILSVGSDNFDAVLSDPSDLTLTERATFQKTEVKPDSIKMVRPGATFYWFLGLEDSADGQRRRASVIWMKRGGQITQDKYLAEWKKVQELWGSIEWSEPKTATGS